MKKILLLLAFFPFLTQAQNVEAKLGSGGAFIIFNSGTPPNEFVKFLIKETGEVNWYLDGQDLFIRDGNFEAYTGQFYKYDFMHIDGVNGRIGFNVLNGFSDGSPGGETNLPLTSSVSLYGSLAYRVRTVNFSSGGITTYTVKQDDNILMLNKADNTRCEIYLTSVASSAGRIYTLKRDQTSSGDIWLHPPIGEKLNGVVDKEIKLDKDNSSLQVVCDGTGWWILSEVSTSVPSSYSITTNTNTALASDNFIKVNFTSQDQIINLDLPAAADYEGQRYEIKRNANGTVNSGNVLRIVPAIGENLDQSTNTSPYLLEKDFESVTVESNGTRWLIVNKYKPENAIREESTNSTIGSSDQTLLIPNSSTINLTLPGITTVPVGKTFTIKRKAGGAGVVTLLGGGANVEGAASLTIDGTTLSTVTVQSDGVAWWVISKF